MEVEQLLQLKNHPIFGPVSILAIYHASLPPNMSICDCVFLWDLKPAGAAAFSKKAIGVSMFERRHGMSPDP